MVVNGMQTDIINTQLCKYTISDQNIGAVSDVISAWFCTDESVVIRDEVQQGIISVLYISHFSGAKYC